MFILSFNLHLLFNTFAILVQKKPPSKWMTAEISVSVPGLVTSHELAVLTHEL